MSEPSPPANPPDEPARNLFDFSAFESPPEEVKRRRRRERRPAPHPRPAVRAPDNRAADNRTPDNSQVPDNRAPDNRTPERTAPAAETAAVRPDAPPVPGPPPSPPTAAPARAPATASAPTARAPLFAPIPPTAAPAPADTPSPVAAGVTTLEPDQRADEVDGDEADGAEVDGAEAGAFDPSTFFPSDVFGTRSVITARVPPRLPFQPSLEGLRGVAILAVLLFFADAPFLGGGFLAISLFLTLTGFLVTRNLLGRMLDDEPIMFGETAKTRLRRLMPIAVLGVAAGVLYTVVLGDVGQVNRLFGDVITSLTFTANWRYVAQSQSYLSLLASPSALQQYWTLAVAEQVNLVVVLAALGSTIGIARSRDARTGTGAGTTAREAVRALTVVIGVLIVVSIGCTVFLGYSHSRVYFGTDTRAAEILLGALLAVMLVHRPTLGSSKYAPAIATAGLIAAAASVALWFVTPISSPWVYTGGLVAYALVSMAVIAGALVPRGPLATVLSVRPLREVGKIAFGLYVFSWPVYLACSPERVHLTGAPLFVLRIAVTAGLAFAAHRFIEAPVRAGRTLYSFKPSAAIGGTIAVIMLTTMATASNAPAPAIDLSQPYTAAGVAIGNGQFSIPSLAVFGDSTAIPIQRGLTKWVESTNRAVSRQGRFAIGCGLVPGGAWQLGATTGETPASCDQLQQEWAEALEPGAPSMAIVTPGLLEVANRRVPGDDRWRAIGVPETELYYMKQMLAITDTLSSKGAKVVWLTMPPVLAGTQYDARPALGPAVDPARATRLNELIRTLPEMRPDKVAVVDLAGWLAENDPDATRYRPDGVHLSDDGAAIVAQNFLAPELLKLAGQDPNTLTGLGPGAAGLPGPTGLPGSGSVTGGSPACSAARTFGLGELGAGASADRPRAEREQAFATLISAGGQLQQLVPDLNDAVEARQAYWSEALGLAAGDENAPAEPPPPSSAQNAAAAAIEDYKQTNCR